MTNSNINSPANDHDSDENYEANGNSKNDDVLGKKRELYSLNGVGRFRGATLKVMSRLPEQHRTDPCDGQSENDECNTQNMKGEHYNPHLCNFNFRCSITDNVSPIGN